jgi:penicillin-binding protein 1C
MSIQKPPLLVKRKRKAKAPVLIPINRTQPFSLRQRLAAKFRKKSNLFIFVLVLVGAGFFYSYILKDLPSLSKLGKDTFPVSTQIFDRNHVLLYEIYAEKNRNPVKLEDIPLSLQQATIAIEDKNFYRHVGFDLEGITRAFLNTVFKKNLQGGSTITQQLIKTTLLNPERTIQRKVREAILTILTEIVYTKAQILEMYLNHIPYGGTAYGVEQAAQKYFNKPVKNLTLAEASFLAGLPQAPSKYSPFGSQPENAGYRHRQVLQRLLEEGYISQEQKTAVEAETLEFASPSAEIRAPHFVMFVKDLLVEKYGIQKVETGGLRVVTSLDINLQETAQSSLSARLTELTDYQVSNGAALVTKPKTGEILAMIGSRDYFNTDIDGNVNITTSLRQPGSSIKPINYAVGLIKGFTPATIFLDMPTCFRIPGQPLYCPKNYDGSYHGPVQMRFALGNSYNIPAVKMLALNGVDAMIATASAMGITTWNDPSRYGLSLTLGGGEVKMVDMAVAFGVFANSGQKIDLHPILKVSTYQGEVLEDNNFDQNPPKGVSVLPDDVSYLISHMLLDNNARSAAFGSHSNLVVPGKTVSVKTGTTDDLRDNWTIGYTPSFLVATWVGNNDNTPMNRYLVSGITGAAPIWNDLMRLVLTDQPDEWPKKPDDIDSSLVCTWAKSDPNNPNSDCAGRNEFFVHDTAKNPKNGRIEKKNIWVDKDTGQPPAPGKTDNLELKEHIIVSDAFVSDYCLDCGQMNTQSSVIDIYRLPKTTP